MTMRAAPDGARLQPLEAEGTFTWDTVSPLVMTLAPAGHEPGLYQIVQTGYPVTPATSGTLTSTLAWHQPRFGATTLVLNLGNLTLNSTPGALRVIESSGVLPITLTFTGVSIVGTPSIAVACTALLKAFPVVS